jgi:LysR family transcriptional activator of mexEF-oprN operon
MNAVHAVNERDLDFNLLKVLFAVADTGSVTAAASRLYLTQSAVSAALGRLRTAIGEPIVARHGRGVVLTERGARLVAEARPHFDAVAHAVLQPARFDPKTTDAIVRIGLADIADEWLLPPLLRYLETEAPHLRLICRPTEFRSVGEALATRRLDLAVTVVDELPASIARQTLIKTHFVCLFDPRHVRLGATPTQGAYFAQDHVIVSYNGDLRGLIEDRYGRERRIRCSVASFSSIGAVVDGSSLVATIPAMLAPHIIALRPHLRQAALPFDPEPGEFELFWPKALDSDPACRFVREAILRLTQPKPGKPEKRARLR